MTAHSSSRGPTGECLTESELDRLEDHELIEYIVDRRENGGAECPETCIRKAMGILAFGYWPLVHATVSAKVPEDDVEDVASQAIESALKATFEGKSIGEFVNMLKTIAKRRVADFHRKREGKPALDQLPSDMDGEDDWAKEPEYEEEGYASAEMTEAAGRVLERLDPTHQLVIRVYGPEEYKWLNYPAQETADKVNELVPGAGMTTDNVYQIWKRFREDLHRELGMGGS